MIDIYDMTHANDPMILKSHGDVTQTLMARMGTGGNQVPVVHTYAIAGNTIGRKAGNGGNGNGNGNGFQEDISYTLTAMDKHAVAPCNEVQNNTVRRLTPLECERLQGYPDGWTDIEFHGKPAPDTRRYKAIGNGMAQPCADFVIQRIVDEAYC